jgi:hypothetical protein
MYNFAGDANCVARYRFQADALTADSKGTNEPLLSPTEDQTPTANPFDYREFSASAHFDRSLSQFFSLADAYLDAGFPGKSGTTNKTLSITCWIKLESLNASCTFVNKAGGYSSCFWLRVNDATLQWLIGDGAMGWETYSFGTVLQTDRWYHVGVTYRDDTKAWRIRVWDDTAQALLAADATGTGTYNIGTPANTPFYIGSAAGFASHCFDGWIDEVVIFNDILTPTEIDTIRAGGSSSSSSSSSSLSSSSSASLSSSSSDSSSSSFVPLAWPTLSKGVEFDTQELAGAHDVTIPMGNGQVKIRPRYTRRPHRWRIRYRLLTLDDRMALERFYHIDCQRSKYTFAFVERGMNQTWLVRWDPDEPPRFAHEERCPGKFRLDAVLLEDCAGSYGSGQYGAQYYDS